VDYDPGYDSLYAELDSAYGYVFAAISKAVTAATLSLLREFLYVLRYALTGASELYEYLNEHLPMTEILVIALVITWMHSWEAAVAYLVVMTLLFGMSRGPLLTVTVLWLLASAFGVVSKHPLGMWAPSKVSHVQHL
jgi:hypothetical protein